MIPETIKIGGVKYTIERISPDHAESYGKAIFKKAKIIIEDDINVDMALATLLHEVVEVINEENQLKLKHYVIQSIATQLFQVLKDNPEVFK